MARTARDQARRSKQSHERGRGAPRKGNPTTFGDEVMVKWNRTRGKITRIFRCNGLTCYDVKFRGDKHPAEYHKGDLKLIKRRKK